MPKKLKILSIDGGGIRGIIPALILAEVEKRTQKNIHTLFDLIAGSSVGAILALGLSRPKFKTLPEFSASDIAATFEKEGGQIFSRDFLHFVLALDNLLDERYSSKGFEKTMKKYFGDTRLKEALTTVLIPAYDIEKREPYFFKSTKAKEDDADDYPMWQVAMAAAAAPTYFEPVKLPIAKSPEYRVLIDGGVFANNPAMAALVESQKLYSEEPNCILVSIGTGEHSEKILYEDAKNFGLAGWALPILNVVFDGISDAVDYHVRKILPPINEENRYFRFQPSLTGCSDSLDNVDSSNLRGLKELANELISKESKKIDALCKYLVSD